MFEHYEWLPDMILLEDCGGDWGLYVDTTYAVFRRDFIIPPRPMIDGNPVHPKRMPVRFGKEESYFHLTHRGPNNDDREPDLRRCERLPWARAVIENHASPYIKKWTERRSSYEIKLHLWLFELDYLVVLSERCNHYLLCTAYHVDSEHARRKLQQRFEKWSRMS